MDCCSNKNHEEVKQFGCLEALALPYLSLSYFVTVGVTVSIIFDKYNNDITSEKYLYILFFLLPKLMGGLKSIAMHVNEIRNNDTKSNWFIYALFLPFSSILRYYKAWRYGMQEKHNAEAGIWFVEESMRAAKIRLFDSVLGDIPIVILLTKDDVWANSENWQLAIEGTMNDGCLPFCVEKVKPNMRWLIFRLLFLLSMGTQALVFYKLSVKRYQHLQNREYFAALKTLSARMGKINIFGVVLFYFGNFFFVASRIISYSLLMYVAGPYVLLIASVRWIFNSVWHFITTSANDITTYWTLINRYIVSLATGFVWLFGLTNDEGGHQLGRYFTHFTVSILETITCCFIWITQTRGTGNFFTIKAPWANLITLFISAALITLFYAMCHPSNPKPSSKGILFCVKDRRHIVPIKFDDTNERQPEY